MKLKLTQPGFENYTGQMGVVFFKDGISTTDVLAIDATRMSAVMGCEWVDGSVSNVAQRLLDEADTPAPIFTAPEVQEEPEVEAPAAEKYTEEQLAQIADEHGIGGLREIADKMDIKDNSIRGLIEKILKAQA